MRPEGIAVSGSNLFVANYAVYAEGTTIRRIHHVGVVVNASLISGLNGPMGIAVSGSDLIDLFVTNQRHNTIGEYTTSGAVVNASLVSGLNDPYGIAVTISGPSTATWTNGAGGNWSVASNWSGWQCAGRFGLRRRHGHLRRGGHERQLRDRYVGHQPAAHAMTFSSTSSYVLQGSGTNVADAQRHQRGGDGHGERRLAHDRRAA